VAGRAVSLVSPADRDLLRGIQRLLPSPIEHVTIESFATSASSQDALPEAGRRHQGNRQGRGFGGSRQGGRPEQRRTGPRPSRPGGRSFASRHSR
jgi:hypothetical protein